MALFRKSLKKVHKTLKQNEQDIKKWEKKGEEAPKPPKKSRVKEYFIALLGLILLILAIIGLIAGGMFFRGRALDREQADAQKRLAHYTRLIAPVVLFDTGEFVHPEEANNLSLLIPAYFRAWEQNGCTADAVTMSDAGGRFTLSDEEVMDAAEELFGRSVICQSFSLDGVVFEYVENEHCFRTPVTVYMGMYAPKIIETKEKEDGVLLTVQYMELPEYTHTDSAKTVEIFLKGAYGKETVESISVVTE